MSYNITNIDTLYINATMAWEDLRGLIKNHRDSIPEICFLEDLYEVAELLETPPQEDEKIKITKISWSAMFSGNTWKFFQQTVAPLIKGEVQGIATWEGGDSIEGFGIKDGKFYSCNVIQRLDLPEGFTHEY